MTLLTLTLTIWIPVLLGAVIGYLASQLFVRRASVPETHRHIDRARN